MAVDSLSFTKVWTEPSDFPTFESSEDKVREDLQFHPDAIKDYINEQIVPALNDVISGTYTPGAVVTSSIADNAVTRAKLSKVTDTAGAAVGGSEIMDGAISLAKMASGSVGTSQIINGSVTGDKLASSSVTAAKLGSDILPAYVGIVVGTGDPTQDESLLANGQIYLKLES